MPFTLSDLDATDKAIASGALTVNYPDGGGITYRSMDDLLKGREMIVGDLTKQGLLPADGGASSATAAVTQSLAYTSRD